MRTYPIEVAGVKRELPICKVTEDLYIGAFIVFGDAELTVACARELLKLDTLPRELAVMLIQKIEIGEQDPDTGQQEVKIHWKF